ncbi:glycosyltransferase family 2 protein [Lampropedia aestuarii]|uniref:glycosyltransferase family 2 protein n=1 Tax=Lampropedia aestuarii TaxID=2562762 RepID=UPI002469858E|nr:glycosyltransferase [Lampropedia aestuarii]MDH5858577.1 glycosyltransferase [Lampropedia aestuarii]
MQVDQPLISVVIPVFNGSAYIKNCLDGIFSQSYDRLEVIVVDDGSTDATAAIAGSYPVKLIQQKNKGVSAARNLGIQNATGQYIHFMDADDRINKDFYANLLAPIMLHGADISCGGMVNEKSKELTHSFKKVAVHTSIQKKLQVTYAGRIGYVWRYLFCSDFIRSNALTFPEGRIIEDLVFSMEAIFLSKKLVTAPNALYTYVDTSSGHVASKTEAQLKKQEEDAVFAREFRDRLARENNFKIPGVNQGKIRYRLWRALNKVRGVSS